MNTPKLATKFGDTPMQPS